MYSGEAQVVMVRSQSQVQVSGDATWAQEGQGGPSPKTCQQNGPGAGAGLAAAGTGSCMRPPQNLSNMCMSVLGLSQTRGLKTAEVYSLSVLEARSSTSRCQQNRFLPESLRETPSLAPLLLLMVLASQT